MNSNDKYQEMLEDAKELVELQEEQIKELTPTSTNYNEVAQERKATKKIVELETKLAECIYSHDKMTRAYVDEVEKVEKLKEQLKQPQQSDTAQERKATPIYSGVLMYFPDAIREIAKASQAGNDQHHKDKPLHWDRAKSGDELDALTRHLMDAGTLDTDGIKHSAKVAWRALANLQKEIERERNEH